ncbi:hypothetical protein D9611_010224 [Ephemerocybe angulata]|uniref:DUF6533 domain-containing protein n=1 Tax=Ephemerocybe angulata TaxID=980116 RepID=A0A8H5B0R3_9AGAR|nr:hypothetical protein D9611_010224 [Tulosesus angulatus]
MAELSEEARQGFIAFGEGVMKGSLFYIACMTLVLYDHLTTLDLEIELIWKKKWSLIQVLYLINRYLPDISFLYGVSLTVWVSEETHAKLWVLPPCRLLRPDPLNVS